jgi:actin-related protein 10
MLSSILITGGTASMPGFIPKLRDSLLHLLAQSNNSTNTESATDAAKATQHRITSPEFRAAETKAWRYRHHTPYVSLAPLRRRLVVFNDPSPLDTDTGAQARAGGIEMSEVGMPANMQGGRVPRWTPGLMSWVGGSLAGYVPAPASERGKDIWRYVIMLVLTIAVRSKREDLN